MMLFSSPGRWWAARKCPRLRAKSPPLSSLGTEAAAPSFRIPPDFFRSVRPDP